MDMETTTMQLIVNSGDARSKAMEAIGDAKSGDFNSADQKLSEAEEALSKAHEFQTDLIQDEADGAVEKMTILMAHAQDHLMCAIVVLDLAREIIDLYRKIDSAPGKQF
jgi:PTS system cellobiose-specific IIA component